MCVYIYTKEKERKRGRKSATIDTGKDAHADDIVRGRGIARRCVLGRARIGLPALRRRPLVILGQLPLVSEVFQLLLPVIILLARLTLVQSLLRHLLHLPNLLMRSIKTLLILVFLDSLGLTKLHSCFLRGLILL